MPTTLQRPASTNATAAHEPTIQATANHVLASLPEPDRRALLATMTAVRLQPGTALFDVGDTLRHAHFPTSGVISLFGMTTDGDTLQVAAVDVSGFLGIPLVLDADRAPYYAVAHVSCDTLRVDTATMRDACQRSTSLHRAVLQCAHAQVIEIGDAAVCHRFHSVLQRLSRVLLAYSTSMRSATVPLTQEVLARILGSERSAISRAAMTLQDCGATRQRHGGVQVLNRGALRTQACDCAPAEGIH